MVSIYSLPCSRTKHQIKTWVWTTQRAIFVILAYDSFHCISHTNRFFIFPFFSPFPAASPRFTGGGTCGSAVPFPVGHFPADSDSTDSTENSKHCSDSWLTKCCSLMALAADNSLSGMNFGLQLLKCFVFVSKHSSSYDVGCKQTVFWSL